MKVLLLKGSPHLKGTTALLADEFSIGVKEAGHEIVSFDTAKLNINPCLGCNHCRENNGNCIYKDDDMAKIYPQLLSADVVVLVTPLYYFGMAAQLKRTIDRFFAVNSLLREKSKKLYMIAACGDNDDWAMDALIAHYHAISRYLKWQECGELLAIGAYTREDAKNSEYPAMARKLGRELK